MARFFLGFIFASSSLYNCLTGATHGQPLRPARWLASVTFFLGNLVHFERFSQKLQQKNHLRKIVIFCHLYCSLSHPVPQDVSRISFLHHLQSFFIRFIFLLKSLPIKSEEIMDLLILETFVQTPRIFRNFFGFQILQTKFTEISECLCVVSLDALHNLQQKINQLLIIVMALSKAKL